MPQRNPIFKPHSYRNEAHRKAEFDKRRRSSRKRGYDADWEKVRAMKLMADPWCECDECKEAGVLTPATVVDHIKSIEERPDLRLDMDNLRSMSKPHHDRRTAKEQGFARGKT